MLQQVSLTILRPSLRRRFREAGRAFPLSILIAVRKPNRDVDFPASASIRS
jgi:hypothetical protein